MPSKPRKYGVKMMVLNVAKTHLYSNAYIYSDLPFMKIKKWGKQAQSVYVRLPLMEPTETLLLITGSHSSLLHWNYRRNK
jgi:hypothetical protein